MTQANPSDARAGHDRKNSASRGSALILIALSTLLYASGSYAFAFLIIAVLLLAPQPLSTAIGAYSRRVAISLSLLAIKFKERSHTPAVKLGFAATFVTLLLGAAFLGGDTWIASALYVAFASLTDPSAEYVFFAGIIFFSLLHFARKKFRCGQLLILLGVLWVMMHESVTLFLNKIGVDSLSEANNFDVQEAKFWLSTLDEAITLKVDLDKLIICVALSIFSFFFLKRLLAANSYSKRKSSYFKLSVAVLLMGSGIYLTISDSLAMFVNSSRDFLHLSENFSGAPPVVINDQKKMAVLVYIGESTSTMNMGLYGYPRNTTPGLDAFAKYDENLIVFKNVFSTHVHTSPSLLEALSFGVNERDSVLPIDERMRISIVDVVKSQGSVQLYSNQGASGSYNRASSVIFKNAERVFSAQTSLLGNAEIDVPRPVEHEFFKKINLAGNLGKSLVFLHSYSGHGPYLVNIPESFREPVDATYRRENSKAVMGNLASITTVDEYDSAIRYIDFSVSELLLNVRNSPEPSIVIYFSDHGDAVFAGRGHDSTRLVHEMMRVPFLIYFNDAARKSYPEKYEKYLALSKEANVATLAQLPSTIIDLMGLELSKSDQKAVLEKPLIGESTRHDPIVVRRTSKGLTHIKLDDAPAGRASDPWRMLTDKTDHATSIFKARNKYKKSGTKFCYHGSNSVAKAIRAGMLTDCVEVDLVAQHNGGLGGNDSPASDIELNFSEIYWHASKNNMAIWIDGKNLASKNACWKVADFLKNQKQISNTVLIEFPTGAYQNKDAIFSCVDELRRRHFPVAYHVSVVDAASCSNAIKGGKASAGETSCGKLSSDLESAYQSGLFTDFSFPYGGLAAMEALDAARKLRWNTWGVPVAKLDEVRVDRFRMITLSNADPNTP